MRPRPVAFPGAAGFHAQGDQAAFQGANAGTLPAEIGRGGIPLGFQVRIANLGQRLPFRDVLPHIHMERLDRPIDGNGNGYHLHRLDGAWEAGSWACVIGCGSTLRGARRGRVPEPQQGQSAGRRRHQNHSPGNQQPLASHILMILECGWLRCCAAHKFGILHTAVSRTE